MRYFESISFIANKGGWILNLVFCGLCFLIPVAGPIVVIGYSFEVFDALHRDPEKQNYPFFEFDRFGTYFMRGIWPLIVNILAGVVLMIPTFILAGIMFA